MSLCSGDPAEPPGSCEGPRFKVSDPTAFSTRRHRYDRHSTDKATEAQLSWDPPREFLVLLK